MPSRASSTRTSAGSSRTSAWRRAASTGRISTTTGSSSGSTGSTSCGSALTLGLPFLIGYAVGGSWQRGVEALVWGGLIRIFLYQHATFSVNSICHMFGRRDFRSRDEASNNWLVALLVFGEGWHNNHHAFPASARHGLGRLPARRLLVGDPRAGEAPPRLEREGPVRNTARAPQAGANVMRVAVVGSGVAGLGAAHLLARAHDVEVFEREAAARRARQHGLRRRPRARHRLPRPQRAELPAAPAALRRARRPDAGVRHVVLGQLRALWARVRRAAARSRSAGTRRARASSRCSGRSPAGCGPPGGRSTSRSRRARSLGQYLDERGYSHRFRRHFLVPLTAALWSTAPGRALEFPAGYAIRFFDNHGMLGFGRFRWRTRRGGQPDVRRRARRAARAAARTSGSAVRSVRRDAGRRRAAH